jgi:hypothetical protein
VQGEGMFNDEPFGEIPVDALDYLRSVYRDPMQSPNTRMRAAAIAIEYERPRLRERYDFSVTHH